MFVHWTIFWTPVKFQAEILYPWEREKLCQLQEVDGAQVLPPGSRQDGLSGSNTVYTVYYSILNAYYFPKRPPDTGLAADITDRLRTCIVREGRTWLGFWDAPLSMLSCKEFAYKTSQFFIFYFFNARALFIVGFCMWKTSLTVQSVIIGIELRSKTSYVTKR